MFAGMTILALYLCGKSKLFQPHGGELWKALLFIGGPLVPLSSPFSHFYIPAPCPSIWYFSCIISGRLTRADFWHSGGCIPHPRLPPQLRRRPRGRGDWLRHRHGLLLLLLPVSLRCQLAFAQTQAEEGEHRHRTLID